MNNNDNYTSTFKSILSQLTYEDKLELIEAMEKMLATQE